MTSTLKEQKEKLTIMKKTLLDPKKFKEKKITDKACFSYNYTKYGYFDDWAIALNILNDLPKTERICNEMILENSKVKGYLDIEWLKSEHPEYSSDMIKCELKNDIIVLLKSQFNLNFLDDDGINPNNILFSQCHRQYGNDYKFSFHVVINTKPMIVFQNANAARFLATKLRDIDNVMMNNKIDIKDQQLPEYYKKKAIIYKNIIDNSVYHKTQNIRMIGQCKMGEFDHPFIKDPSDTSYPLVMYMITCIDTEHLVLDIDEQADQEYLKLDKIKQINLSVRDDDNGEREYYGDYYKEIIEKIKLLHPSAHIEKTCSQNNGFIQFNYTDRNEPCFTNDNVKIYHQHIGFFAYLSESDNTLMVGCHSGRCENDKQKKIIIKIGSIGCKKLLFEKVDENSNTFPGIPLIKIKMFIRDGAIGMSNLFKEMYLKPKRIKWIPVSPTIGSSYIWNGKLWEEDDSLILNRLITITVVNVLRDFIKNSASSDTDPDDNTMSIKGATKIINDLNEGRTTNIVRFLNPLLKDNYFSKLKDIHPYRLSCKNGMINLVTGEINLAVPDDNITKCIDLNYNKDADSSDFDNFVKQITEGIDGPRIEIYNYLRWIIGYALQGNPNKKIFIILYGEKGYNGKSLLMNTINDILEYYSATMDKSIVLEGQQKSAGAHSSELCQLENCRFGILTDTKENSSIDDGQVKQITGGTDTLSTREIFGKQKEFIPTFVPFISSNHPIKLNLNDKAMYERLIVIPFNLSFVREPVEYYERQDDPSLPDKFKSNKEGILKWLIDASMYYNQDKTKLCPNILKEAKEEYNKQVDNYTGFMEKNFTKLDPEALIGRTIFFSLFTEYMKDNNIKIAKKQYERDFDKILEVIVMPGKRKKFYKGLVYINEEEEEDAL